jgi:hypothetical protein
VPRGGRCQQQGGGQEDGRLTRCRCGRQQLGGLVVGVSALGTTANAGAVLHLEQGGLSEPGHSSAARGTKLSPCKARPARFCLAPATSGNKQVNGPFGSAWRPPSRTRSCLVWVLNGLQQIPVMGLRRAGQGVRGAAWSTARRTRRAQWVVERGAGAQWRQGGPRTASAPRRPRRV